MIYILNVINSYFIHTSVGIYFVLFTLKYPLVELRFIFLIFRYIKNALIFCIFFYKFLKYFHFYYYFSIFVVSKIINISTFIINFLIYHLCLYKYFYILYFFVIHQNIQQWECARVRVLFPGVITTKWKARLIRSPQMQDVFVTNPSVRLSLFSFVVVFLSHSTLSHRTTTLCKIVRT